MTDLPRSFPVDLTIDMKWSDKICTHHDHFFAPNVNPWRDALPGGPIESFFKNGPPCNINAAPGTLVLPKSPSNTITVYASKINDLVPFEQIRAGRFYPRGCLTGVPGIFKENRFAFLCLEKHENRIIADLNHPMADRSIDLTINQSGVCQAKEERGGAINDWMQTALTGPGMQTALVGRVTDQMTRDSFARTDTRPDIEFYRTDRMVNHIDTLASSHLATIHKDLISKGSKILDLMSSWTSHVPANLDVKEAFGIGMNEHELEKNALLTGYQTQDFNQSSALDFPDNYFDVALCALSIEYLTDPLALIRQTARVLKPKGRFIVSFSNRWFPEKVTRLWTNLHDFERLGFVAGLFHTTGLFTDIRTRSVRGYPRPVDDRHWPKAWLSDPVYVVTGTTKTGAS